MEIVYKSEIEKTNNFHYHLYINYKNLNPYKPQNIPFQI